MENLLIYVVAVILAASLIVGFVRGEAAAIRRDEQPVNFWFLFSSAAAGLVALFAFGVAE